MSIDFLILVAGFIILVAGANWLVNGSVSLAKKYNISELAIGLTVVAFGTSAPELVVNITSSIKKINDITVGNIIGSNLFNLMLILGISGIVYPLTVQTKTVWKEIPFSMLAALLALILANDKIFSNAGPSIGLIDGIILLVCFGAFLYYIYINMKAEFSSIEGSYKTYSTLFTIFFIIGGLAALIIGSQLVVNKAVIIASKLGVSEKLIGLTIISAGTSLPELLTSVVAAFKKRSDIAIGNVIGSNIFNIFLIMGASAFINPIKYNTAFNFDITLLIIASILLFSAMFTGKRHKLDRWESFLLFTGYLVYLVYIIKRN